MNYHIYKNGIYLESHKRRYQAEEAIRVYKHQDRMQTIENLGEVPCNTYEIRR